jgi:DNA replication and repair protein RecF
LKLTNLKLHNFRNYEDVNLEFTEQFNVFIGENAQGKTNLLESIYALGVTKSHRTNKYQQLIRFDTDASLIQGTVEKSTTTTELELDLSAKGRKTKVDHLPTRKISDYFGNLNVVLFSPEDLYLIKGGPKLRRDFLDIELGQINKIYLYELMEYQKVLASRNAYLKQIINYADIDEVYLEVIDEQLAKLGKQVVDLRIQFLARLEETLQKIYQNIAHKDEKIEVSYLTDIKDDYAAQLKANRRQDFIKGSTQIGPHRDDLIFKINGKDVKNFGSQGQQRTVILSLKIAEIQLFFEETNEYPLLLLDDVLSELDQQRQEHIFNAIKDDVQTFITTTDLGILKDKLNKKYEVFEIQEGKIIND